MQHEMQHEISEDDTAPAHHRGICTSEFPDDSDIRWDYDISILFLDYDFKSFVKFHFNILCILSNNSKNIFTLFVLFNFTLIQKAVIVNKMEFIVNPKETMLWVLAKKNENK